MAEVPEFTDEGGGLEASGKNVDEAVAKALSQLRLRRDEVDLQVLSEGRAGILGVGAQPARVRVAPRAKPLSVAPVQPFPDLEEDDNEPEPAAVVALPAKARVTERPPREPSPDLDLTTESAVDVLETLLQLMGLGATVSAREPETPGDGAGMIAAVLDVTSVDEADLGLLIGRRGETLAALQYMVNLIVNHQTHSRDIFGVDIEGYRRRRENALMDLAKRIADRVRANGQAMTLEPMPPAERRIVHMTLADDPDIETVSIGEGDARKVAITPRR